VPGDIQSAGVIQVASDATYPPFESVRDGVVVGLEPDLAKAIGDVLGVRVEFVNSSFDAIIPSLAAKSGRTRSTSSPITGTARSFW
jgi:polar amino acid transport system substrate-binding protein